ncbi:hypothetical protein DY000_02001937 [Brassica cretica]|uniref:F-box domain-containing protein n=1 Tax=Brassica cretica TaxID=69181 RepID=A0ABQ7CCE9_BRACR|nr:hypothetical protein DY000_02001937 [Brassica cretica]
MDKISRLPDELLVKILSFLPTKVAVSTSILSKQWDFLWMWLPKLDYSTRKYSESECTRLRRFLNKNLPLHRAPIIESFSLDFLASQFKPVTIRSWLLTAVSRNLREVEVSHGCNNKVLNMLPNVKYKNEDSLQRLLSNCPVLEDLVVEGCKGDNMVKFIVIVPSLQRLTVNILEDLDEFVMDTPSLKYFKLDYYNYKNHHCLIERMPKLEEAYVELSFNPVYIDRFIGSITSVKRLTLCIDDVYGDGFVFDQLEHLQLCTCDEQHTSGAVIVRLLKDSPNLRVLDLFKMEYHNPIGLYTWNQPSTVPECILSSLQTFKCSGYSGRPGERDLVIYILKNANHLKTATIWFPTVDMKKELVLSSRASNACQLVFD